MSDTTHSSAAPQAQAPTAPHDDVVARLNEIARGTLVERLGIVIVSAAADCVVGTMPVAGNTQPAGLLHGGASAALAETLGSYAATLHAGPERQIVGIELSATHHRGVRSGSVRGTAQALHLGRTTASYEIVVVDEEERRVCTARLTCLVLEPRQV
jgi:uncharacterized protein (TIGR00369 family)